MGRLDEHDLSLGNKSLRELTKLRDFYKRNADAEVEAARAKGGVGTNKLDENARDLRNKQVEVDKEINDRIHEIHRSRSKMAQRVDEALRAPVPEDPEEWVDDPAEWDWPGVDLP